MRNWKILGFLSICHFYKREEAWLPQEASLGLRDTILLRCQMDATPQSDVYSYGVVSSSQALNMNVIICDYILVL